MGFSRKQLSTLQRPLNVAHIRTKQSPTGRDLSYIEGWHVIAEANRIFGPDGWNRETLESKCVLARENKGTYLTVYTCKVRITVNADGQTIVREGHGTGEARGASPGEVHDTALKTSETDATKRALATFGKPFGLSLYLSVPFKTANRDRAKDVVDRRSTPQRSSAAPQEERQQGPRSGDACGADETRVSVTEPAVSTAPDLSDSALLHTLENQPQVQAVSASAVSQTSLQGADQQTGSFNSSGRDKSELTLPLPRRHRDKEHLRYVAAQPCLICSRTPSDAHHVRFAQPKGLGLKSSDEFTVPLCRIHHSQLHHSGNEIAWWNDLDVDPLPIAEGLWQESRQKRRTTA